MSNRAVLRGIIKLKLEARLLPIEDARRRWAGPGNGEVCSACDEAITKKQVLQEWDCDGVKVYMHIDCYELWNSMRSR